ncbi:MAG: SIMPL domain-containing protein, partial [Rhizobacter sp.]|nr:SIMPL domain-containing protein [Rhizobacter sp.]
MSIDLSLLRVLLPPSLALVALPALGADPAAPQGVVHLSTNASIEVTKDLLTVTLSTSRDGQDAATVQAQLKQALDAALAEA